MCVARQVPEPFLETLVWDREQTQHTIGALVRGRTCLLVFLRHFGCIGCTQRVDRLTPRLKELSTLGLQILFISNGKPQHIAGFAERHQLADKPVSIYTDPELASFRALALKRSVWGVFGVRGLYQRARALGRGYQQHDRQGDDWQQGGDLLLDSKGIIVYLQRSRYLGDDSDPSDLVDAAMQLLLREKRAAGGAMV